MVAHQDRHALAGLETVLAPGVGDRIGAFIQLAVGELAAFVDEGNPIPVADRPRADRAPEHPVALEREHHLGDPVGQLGGHQAAADAQRREVRLVAEALDQLRRPGEKCSGV